MSRIPRENTQINHLELLIVTTMIQSRLGNEVGIPEVCPQLPLIQKSMVVDSSPKLTPDDWIKEQHEDSDIDFLVQLLKTDKLEKIYSP